MSKNQAVGSSSALAKLIFFATTAAIFLQGCGGCSGFDPNALDLEGRVINYSKQLEQDPPPNAAIIYGKLSPKSSTEISGNALQGEYKAIFQELDNIVALAKDNESDKNMLLTWKAGIELKLRNEISQLLNEAASDSAKAVLLAKAVAPYLEVGGLLEAGRTTSKSHTSDGLSNDFNRNYDSLVSTVGRLYQIAVVTANRIEQNKARKLVAEINDGIAELRTIFNEDTEVLPAVYRADAVSSLINTHTNVVSASPQIEVMGNEIGRIGPSLTATANEIRNLMTGGAGSVRDLYLDKIPTAATEVRAKVQDIYDLLDASTAAYVALSTNYQQVERTKIPTDANLNILVAKAFSAKEGIAPVLGVTLEHETDINHLARALGRTDVVVLEDNDNSLNMVYALASAVASNVAKLYDLPDATNVVGPDDKRISQDQTDFSMDNAQFDVYLKSLGEKIRAETQTSIYVVFADRFPKDAKVSLLIEGLAQNKGKVVVITKNTSAFKGELFSPHGLSVSETLLVADEMFKVENLSVNRTFVSDRLARFFTAFGHVTLSSLTPVVKDVAAKLRTSRSNTSEEGIQAVIIGSLAAKKIMVGPQRSTLLSQSIKDVEDKMRINPLEYQAPPTSGGRGTAEVVLLQVRKMAEASALRDARDGAKGEANSELLSIGNAVKAIQTAAQDKNAKAIESQGKLTISLNQHLIDFNKEMLKVRQTLNACTIANIEPTQANFPVAIRQALLNTRINSVAAIPILQGDVTATQLTKAACLVVGNAKNKIIMNSLSTAQTSAGIAITGFKNKIFECLQKIDTDSIAATQTCLLAAANIIETERKSVMGQAGGAGLLLAITSEIEPFPQLNQALSQTPGGVKSTFWRAAAGLTPLLGFTTGLVIGGLNPTFGDAFSLPGAHGAKMVNQHYYINKLLNIFGTGGGDNRIPIRAGFDYNFSTRRDDNTGAAPALPQNLFFEAFRDFEDNDSLLVQIRRELNSHYKDFLAKKITNMIHGVVQNLYDELIVPFAALSGAQLNDIKSNASYQPVWTEIEKLAPALNELYNALKGDFVKEGDGELAPGDTTNLQNLDGKIKMLGNSLAVLAVAMDTARLAAAADTVLQVKFFDLKTVLDKYVDTTAAVGERLRIYPEIENALEDVYDIAQYNKLRLNGTVKTGAATFGAPTRVYFPGHRKYTVANIPIKHPLDP